MKYVRSLWVGIASLMLMGILAPVYGQVYINEILAKNKGAVRNGTYNPQYVELYNASSYATNISGWTLTDTLNNRAKFALPAGTILQAHGFAYVFCDDKTNEIGLHTGFTLDDNGDDVALFRAGNTNTYVDYIAFGIQAADLSVGRYPDGNTNSGAWKLGPATFMYENRTVALGNPFLLKINEWCATNKAETATVSKDWIELYNSSTNGPVDLSGLMLCDDSGLAGKRPVLALSFLGSDDYVRFWADDFTGGSGANHMNFKISSSSGDYLELWSVSATSRIDRVTVSPCNNCGDYSWGRLPDGGTNIVQFTPAHATPGDSNFQPLSQICNVIINEVLAHTDPPMTDAVEFYNPNATNLDLSYFYLSNKDFNPKKYHFPSNSIIPPYGFLVVYEYQFNPNWDGNDPGFTFNSAHGDQVALFSADAAGNLTGYRLVKAFGSSANGVSFGRYVKSDGGTDLVPMSSVSFGLNHLPISTNEFITGRGASNAYPKVGPIVISEIMYHPPDLIEITNALNTNNVMVVVTNNIDNDWDEFIELSNFASTNALLFNLLEPTNKWSIVDGVEFTFPTGAYIPPSGCAVLVNFDPQTNQTQLAAFRAKYNVPSSFSNFFGPYKGKLSNKNMTLQLNKPDPMQTHIVDYGYVPQIFVEKVKYEDQSPWPTNLVDGGGFSIHRLVLSGYANDQTNWFAAAPTPGWFDTTPTPTPPSFIAPVPQPDKTLQMTLVTTPGLNYTIQGSTNLGDSNSWTTLMVYSNVGSQVIFTDPGTSGYKFFRALIGP